jgi:hypothetical protein
MRPRDTSPEAWKIQMDLIRGMSPEERLERCFALSNTVEGFAKAGLRQRYPEASDREIFLRLARRKLGAELYSKVYGAELAL